MRAPALPAAGDRGARMPRGPCRLGVRRRLRAVGKNRKRHPTVRKSAGVAVEPRARRIHPWLEPWAVGPDPVLDIDTGAKTQAACGGLDGAWIVSTRAEGDRSGIDRSDRFDLRVSPRSVEPDVG